MKTIIATVAAVLVASSASAFTLQHYTAADEGTTVKAHNYNILVENNNALSDAWSNSQDHISDQNEEITDLEDQIAALEAQLAAQAAESAQEIANLEADIETLEADNAQLEADLEHAEGEWHKHVVKWSIALNKSAYNYHELYIPTLEKLNKARDQRDEYRQWWLQRKHQAIDLQEQLEQCQAQ